MGADLAGLVRDIPDFPKPGILFKDITPVLADPAGLDAAVTGLADWARDRGVDVVIGAEARGFLLGSAVARELGAGFALARKPGKLPYTTVRAEYLLEYGTDALELHTDAIDVGHAGPGPRRPPGDRRDGPRARRARRAARRRGRRRRVPARARRPGRPGAPGRRRGPQPARLRRGLGPRRRPPSARAEGPPQPRARRPARRGVGDRRRPDPARALVAEGRTHRGRRRRRLHAGADDRPRPLGAGGLPRAGAPRGRGPALGPGGRGDAVRPHPAVGRDDGARHARGRRGAGRRSRSRQRLRGVAALGGFIVRHATRRIVDEALDGLEEVHGTGGR